MGCSSSRVAALPVESAVRQDEIRIVNSTTECISAVVSEDSNGVRKSWLGADQTGNHSAFPQISVNEENSQMISINPGEESSVTLRLRQKAYVTILHTSSGVIKLVMLNRLVYNQTELVLGPKDLENQEELEEVDGMPGIMGAQHLVSPTMINNRKPAALVPQASSVDMIRSSNSLLSPDAFTQELQKRLLLEHDEQVVRKHFE
jgi:hypothetical protein